MKLSWIPSARAVLILLAYAAATHGSQWGFTDATVSVQTKGAGVGGGEKQSLSPNAPLNTPLTLGATDTLKLSLTTQDGSSDARPHQTYLLLQDPASGLETSFAFSVKESGKAKLDLTAKDIPLQLLFAPSPLQASIVIASFGSSTPYRSVAFDLKLSPDNSFAKPAEVEVYGPLPEIHHIFRDAPRNPPRIISLAFTLVVLAALPALLISWLSLGANISHLSAALRKAPIAHILYAGGIVAMELVFGLYYTSWNLFRTLPVAAVIGVVIFISGSRALSEVQDRRLAGQR